MAIGEYGSYTSKSQYGNTGGGKSTQTFGRRFTGDEDDTTIAAEIEERCSWYESETRTLRRQWLINSAFARGQQFSLLHRTEDRLVNLNLPPGRKQVQVDMIGPWKEHMIANMIKVSPAFEAIPETMDGADVTAARFGTSLLDYYWENWRFIEQYIQICNYLMDFGNAFIYLNYMEDGSKYRSRPVYDPETGLTLEDENGEPLMEKTPIGDIYSRVLMPHNIVTTLDDGPLENKPWVVITQYRSLDYYVEQYGEDGEKVAHESENNKDNYSINRLSSTGSDNDANNRISGANERIYFQPPSDINPEGMIVVTANNIVLSRSPWPYKKLMTYPINHFHLSKEPGEFFARSWIERQISPQRLYNLVWSILAENCDDMVHLKMLIPNQSGVDDTYDMPENLFYNYPFAPTYLEPGNLPAYVINMLQLLEVKIRDLQNYHGASMGTDVSGVRSDVHAQNLQDQDMLPLTIIDELINTSFARLGEKILQIAADKLTEERMIAFTGEDKRIQMKSFKGAMLGNTRKVKVRMKNAHLRKKGSTIANIIQVYQMGGILDQYGQPDSMKLMRMLEFALPESAYDDLQKHTDQAYRDIDKLMQREVVRAYPWQDHKAHLSVKNDFMNSSEFMDLLERGNEEDVQIAQAIMTNVDEHAQMYIQSISGLAPGNQESNTSGGRPSGGAGQPRQAAAQQ